MEQGYVKLYRSLLKWEWYDDANTCRLFLHLLLTVNWKPERWRGVEIQPGQRITSRSKLSQEVSFSIQQVRTSLDKLQATNEVTIKTTRKYTLITVNNYNKYQGDNQATNQQSTNNQPTINQQITTNEEGKKEKKERKKKKGTNVPKKERPEAVQFAEFVSMTNDEYSSLVAKYGEHAAKRCIEILDNYKGSSGKTYDSDYRAILSWVVDRHREERGNPVEPQSKLVTPSPPDLTQQTRRLIEEFDKMERNAVPPPSPESLGIAHLLKARRDDG